MQIADAMEATLEPRGVLVIIEAEHLCMSMRGVQKSGLHHRHLGGPGPLPREHRHPGRGHALHHRPRLIALPRGPIAVLALALVGLVAVPACGGQGDDDGSAATSALDGGAGVATDGTSTTIQPAGDAPGAGGPFCTSIEGIRDLGADGAAEATADEVLAQNEQLLDLLDDADGIRARRTLQRTSRRCSTTTARWPRPSARRRGMSMPRTRPWSDQDPALAARLFNESAHLPAFEFFASRCGIRLE